MENQLHDFEILEIKVREPSPREKQIAEVAREAQQHAIEQLSKAQTTGEYLLQHAAARRSTPQSTAWMWEYGDLTAEQITNELTCENLRQHNEKRAQIVDEMKPAIKDESVEPNTILLYLKRIRNRNNWTYAVLAKFPADKRVTDPLDHLTHNNSEDQREKILYFEPSSACVSHACDDLYKENLKEQPLKTFSIPSLSLSEAKNMLQRGDTDTIEYVMEKGAADGKQDAKAMLLVALLGGYSNENNRVRISDYWNKQSN